MKTKSTLPCESSAAATVAGEDLACGDYVALLSQLHDFPSFFWDASGALLSPHELVRLKIIPANAGEPRKVMAICLPFVYVKTARGEIVALDTRRTQLVRLDRRAAKAVWKALSAPARPAAAATGE